MSDHNDYFVDIATTFDRKVSAVREHASQFSKHPDLEGFLCRLGKRAGGVSDLPLDRGLQADHTVVTLRCRDGRTHPGTRYHPHHASFSGSQ